MTKAKRLRQVKLAALKKARAALAKKRKEGNGNANGSLDERIKARAKAIVEAKMAAAINEAMEAWDEA